MILAGNPAQLETVMRGLLKRRGKRARKPEEIIHRAVVQHLEQREVPGLLWWHTPNGGKRTPAEAGIFKALGVRAGVCDFILVHKGRTFGLELKAPGGKPPTETQMEFVSRLNAAGGFGAIVVGLDAAIKTLETWGLLTGQASLREAAE